MLRPKANACGRDLRSAVPRVTHASLLHAAATPAIYPLTGGPGGFRGAESSVLGVLRAVPAETLNQKTEVRLCLEDSLNRNMLNSFLFYQLTASKR